MGLGGYPSVSLSEAGDMAAEDQLAFRQGHDPIAEGRNAIALLRTPPVLTFSEGVLQLPEPVSD